ncbi:MAG: hypothetical protein IKT02_05345 [Bacteroidales bacterium]|nr:hypothetical protein [Bacteroidales bacterium]
MIYDHVETHRVCPPPKCGCHGPSTSCSFDKLFLRQAVPSTSCSFDKLFLRQAQEP